VAFFDSAEIRELVDLMGKKPAFAGFPSKMFFASRHDRTGRQAAPRARSGIFLRRRFIRVKQGTQATRTKTPAGVAVVMVFPVRLGGQRRQLRAPARVIGVGLHPAFEYRAAT